MNFRKQSVRTKGLAVVGGNMEKLNVIKYNDYHFVPKGWGWERWIVNLEYCGKILHFYKGKKFSWHNHNIKDEFFYVVFGRVILRYGWDEDISLCNSIELNKGDGVHIPTGLIHQVEALEESEIWEVSSHHEDSDSRRVIRGD